MPEHAPSNPFKIDMARNEQFDAFEVCLQVGGFKTEKQAKKFAAVLADFMTDGGTKGSIARVQ